jgi:uncharacterized protein YlxW (UPF0749 family)
MRAWIAQLSLSIVAVVIGVLLVGQLRSQARPLELSSLSAQELSTLVESLRVRNVDLGDGLADLREQIREYELRDVDGQSNLAIGEEDLERISAFAGLRAVRGQGIEMEIEGSFDPQAVNDLVYELRNSGADAIAVDDIRITARSVAVLGTGAIEIDGVPVGRSFTITAIGSPDGLEAALQRPGGILVLLQQSIDARFIITKSQELEVPATQRDLSPQAARAVE